MTKKNPPQTPAPAPSAAERHAMLENAEINAHIAQLRNDRSQALDMVAIMNGRIARANAENQDLAMRLQQALGELSEIKARRDRRRQASAPAPAKADGAE